MGFPLITSGGIPGLRESDWDIAVPENSAGAASPSPEALTASVSSGVEEAGLPEWERRVPQGSPVSWGLLRGPTGSTPGQNPGRRSRLPDPISQVERTLPAFLSFPARRDFAPFGFRLAQVLGFLVPAS